MYRKPLFVITLTVVLLFSSSRETSAQSDTPKFEVGAQFSVIRIENLPTGVSDRRNEPGFGGRFAYSPNKYVALESEVNFFPRSYRGFVTPFSGGRITQGLFGVKAGIRKEKFGVFGKARPGFVSFNRVVKNVQFPNGNGPDPRDPFGFELGSVTHVAIDVGGVVEIYPSRRTMLRFDVGDTIIRYAGVEFVNLPSGNPVVESVYKHNLQFNVGFGWRF
jgi:hypothetical protein